MGRLKGNPKLKHSTEQKNDKKGEKFQCLPFSTTQKRANFPTIAAPRGRGSIAATALRLKSGNGTTGLKLGTIPQLGLPIVISNHRKT